eukprot:TRINITY_DN271_c0_g1_i2.p2 TRINITY_DN271_c0_g1~~TRINITY_DN271_c0_g1_i2.p2  ORF type:complete len:137 (-),score=3.40 TRINITY_DN271_c0_g1_i2:740-1150(-)
MHPPQDGFEAMQYFINRASQDPQAVDLSSRMNITLPNGFGEFRGLVLPVNRLVGMGWDTPENFQILFGPDWAKQITPIWKEQRMMMLSVPPTSSPAHNMQRYLDANTPPRWTPRPPSLEEQEELAKLKAFMSEFRM